MNNQHLNFENALNIARNEARAAVIQRTNLAVNKLVRRMEMFRALQEQRRIQSHSNWVLLRNTTRNNILNGRIAQTDSYTITAVTIANNILRRSMEFVTLPVCYKEDDDDADY